MQKQKEALQNHMSPVAGDGSGANGGVAGDVPPNAVVDEPAQSAE